MTNYGVFARKLAAAAFGCLLSLAGAAHSGALDVDGDGNADALTDGILLVRQISGRTGAALTTGAVSPLATRNEAQIQAHLAGIAAGLDVDGDGASDPTTDGQALLRYLFGFRGPTLIEGVLSPSCTRCDEAVITARLADLAAASGAIAFNRQPAAFTAYSVALLDAAGPIILTGDGLIDGVTQTPLVRTDDRQLALLVPELPPGEHSLAVALNGTSTTLPFVVLEQPVIADPRRYVTDRIDQLITDLDALKAGLPVEEHGFINDQVAQLRTNAAALDDSTEDDIRRLASILRGVLQGASDAAPTLAPLQRFAISGFDICWADLKRALKAAILAASYVYLVFQVSPEILAIGNPVVFLAVSVAVTVPLYKSFINVTESIALYDPKCLEQRSQSVVEDASMEARAAGTSTAAPLIFTEGKTKGLGVSAQLRYPKEITGAAAPIIDMLNSVLAYVPSDWQAKAQGWAADLYQLLEEWEGRVGTEDYAISLDWSAEPGLRVKTLSNDGQVITLDGELVQAPSSIEPFDFRLRLTKGGVQVATRDAQWEPIERSVSIRADKLMLKPGESSNVTVLIEPPAPYDTRVRIDVSGSATEGSDYQTLGGTKTETGRSVTIASDQESAAFTLKRMADGSSGYVVLSLVESDSPYRLDYPSAQIGLGAVTYTRSAYCITPRFPTEKYYTFHNTDITTEDGVSEIWGIWTKVKSDIGAGVIGVGGGPAEYTLTDDGWRLSFISDGNTSEYQRKDVYDFLFDGEVFRLTYTLSAVWPNEPHRNWSETLSGLCVAPRGGSVKYEGTFIGWSYVPVAPLWEKVPTSFADYWY